MWKIGRNIEWEIEKKEKIRRLGGRKLVIAEFLLGTRMAHI